MRERSSGEARKRESEENIGDRAGGWEEGYIKVRGSQYRRALDEGSEEEHGRREGRMVGYGKMGREEGDKMARREKWKKER